MLRESELQLSRQGLRSFAKVVAAVRDVLKDQLGIDDLPFPAETIQPIRDFRERTFKLLAETREPRPREQKALEKKGWVFLSTEAKSLAQVIQEHPDHFGHIDDGLDLAAFTPPSLTLAINRKQPFIHNSFGRSQSVHLLMIDAYSQPIEVEFPRATALMLPASVYAQAGLEYFKTTGLQLFPASYARTLDGLVVGRLAPFVGLDVSDRLHDTVADMHSGLIGTFTTGAIPAVVFIKESYTPQRKIAPWLLR